MREIEAGLLNEDFIDFLKSLKENQVESLLVGGYAVVLHGYHRTTGDIDIWIKPTSENYGRLRKAFAEFGLPLDAITRDNFLSSDQVDVFTFGLRRFRFRSHQPPSQFSSQGGQPEGLRPKTAR